MLPDRRGGALTEPVMSYLGARLLAGAPIRPRFPPNRHAPAKSFPARAAGMEIPSLVAVRRAVSSRRVVSSRTDRRARSSIAAGAVSGVPLLNGGSGA